MRIRIRPYTLALKARNAWYNMHQRCKDTKHKNFHNYGGRGIKVCKRWAIFENFLKDMGLPKNGKLFLDRVDNSKGYTPSNCQWRSMKQQKWNRRRINFVEYKGKKYPISVLSKKLGFKKNTLASRLDYGWSIQDAIKRQKYSKIQGVTKINFNGKKLTIKEWSKFLKINLNTLQARLYKNWPLHLALTDKKFKSYKITCNFIKNK